MGPRRRTAGLLAAGVLAVLALPILALPLLPLGLPDPLAVRWSMDGEPSGSLPRWVAALGPSVIWCVVWWKSSGLAGPVAFVAGVLVTVQVSVLAANLGVETWQDARRLPLPAPVLPLVVGLLAAWVAGRVTTPRPDAEATPAASLAAGERSVWTGTAYNRGALLLLAVPVLGALPMLPRVLSEGASVVPVLLPALLVGLPAVAFTTVRVVVGPEAVAVGLGPWGWPSRRFATGDIARAATQVVEPMDVGGWGWRTGRRGRTAVVIRRGEALVLDLVDGGRFTVTVDGAEHAAALVNAYRALA